MNRLINTEESISKALKGSKFKYKSKYGGYVDGVIERLGFDKTWILDDRRSKLLKGSIKNRSYSVKPEFPLLDKTEGDWNGYVIIPTITSTKGIQYKLDEIILID